ncbi:vomeronasal type-2 receptor 26-like [Lissotriton helveticus]
MVFTIIEINKQQALLPNITLGFQIFDSCLSVQRSLQGTAWLLTGRGKPILNYRCQNESVMTAVIGESISTSSLSMARFLGLYRMPQVSYSASIPLLSDKVQFPSFVRTFPSDYFQAQLLHYLRNVHFKNSLGDEMYFDVNGDPPALYDVINWQLKPDGTIYYVKVGNFDSGAPSGQKLFVNTSAIQWNKKRKEAPRSVCSESCAVGYRKALQKGQPVCCFDCIPCAAGHISNKTDSSNCWSCPEDHWPNGMRTDCFMKKIEFLSYREPLGLVLAASGMLCAIVTIIVYRIFIKYKETPIVKANNRKVTYLLLGSLTLSFLCSLLFIGEPQVITCLLQQTAFGIIFVLCVSCVLAKTMMVVIAFNATKPSSNMRRWLGPQVPVVIVSVCTSVQVLICATWLLLCPPFPEKNLTLKTETIIFQCNECSDTALWCMLGYMGLLACASFLMAFLARHLPDSFNEAKWITFSMLVFLSVWMSFIPGYLSTQGKYMVAVEVFGIISSSAGLFICIFLPKCYIILLRPTLNTRDQLLGKRQ